MWRCSAASTSGAGGQVGEELPLLELGRRDPGDEAVVPDPDRPPEDRVLAELAADYIARAAASGRR